MNTPTEELAVNCGLLPPAHAGFNIYDQLRKKLQAFREAVEAESDAERAEQPAVAYLNLAVWRHAGYTEVFATPERAFDNQDALYAQPFPSTEQLQQRVKELTEALRKVDDAAIECEGEDGELVFSVDADTIHAVRELLDPILANTQRDSK